MENRSTIFLPLVHNKLSNQQAFFNALLDHPSQEHPKLVWDACLYKAANIRALQISYELAHSYKGKYVNQIVRELCAIPKSYPNNKNFLESLVGGVENYLLALHHLEISPSHSSHLFGKGEFYKQQTRIGVAYLQRIGSQYQFYYVILISQ